MTFCGRAVLNQSSSKSPSLTGRSESIITSGVEAVTVAVRGSLYYAPYWETQWLGSRVVSALDSGTEGLGFKSQPQRCRITVLGKLFTPIVPLFTKQRNW